MPKELIGVSCVCVGMGESGTISMLGPVSLFDRRGATLYDTFVKPTSNVESHRAVTTGLDLATSVLGISHPTVDNRDVGLYLPFRSALTTPNDVNGLPTLLWHFMRRKIREHFVDSLEDARAAIDLYRSAAEDWEGYNDRRQYPCALPPVAYNRYYI